MKFMNCKRHLMARILKMYHLLRTSENIMASPFEIASLRKSSNVARLNGYRVPMQASTAPSLRIEIEVAIVYNFLCVVKADYKNILDEKD